MRENDKIPPKALAVMVVSAIAELNFLIAPRDVVDAAGRDAWLSTVLAIVVLLLCAGIIITLIRRYPDASIVEIATRILGKPLGTIVALSYAIYWLARAAYVLQAQTWIFAQSLLPNTPLWVTSLYIVMISTYTARHGVEPMARLFLIFIAGYLLPLFLMIGPSYEGALLDRLLPAMEDGLGPVIKGVWIAFSEAPGLSILLILGPFLTGFRRALSSAMIGVILVAIPAVAVMVIVVAQFGTLDVVQHVFPTLALVELIRFPGFSGFRVDPIFLSVWLLVAFTSIALSHYAAASVSAGLFGLNNDKLPIYAIAGALAMWSLWPVALPDLLNYGLRVRIVAIPVAELFLPALLLTVSLIRERSLSSTSERGA